MAVFHFDTPSSGFFISTTVSLVISIVPIQHSATLFPTLMLFYYHSNVRIVTVLLYRQCHNALFYAKLLASRCLQVEDVFQCS